jgi:hypothetical protein
MSYEDRASLGIDGDAPRVLPVFRFESAASVRSIVFE